MNDKSQYWQPYFAGIVLGLVLLAAFYTVGRGLGASGAMMRTVTTVVHAVAPEHTAQNAYLSRYVSGGQHPLKNWLVFQVLGVLVGGLLSGALANRLKFEVEHGPRFTPRARLFTAFAGGIIFGYAARLAMGCTSGQALTGGATLALGSWAFMMMVFAGGYAMAYFVRRQWI
ncbi:YeeE/YedE thiosulfate transporter family protein [candidate division CSSED10-310 bacterium]|uniref:YeeE/YedE thiosulfate transporter family protein n=1 Tax=candidate division CSSED10-310 bacterium TaxID=2855610 RepID=A0ABV6Z404_UNCC1